MIKGFTKMSFRVSLFWLALTTQTHGAVITTAPIRDQSGFMTVYIDLDNDGEFEASLQYFRVSFPGESTASFYLQPRPACEVLVDPEREIAQPLPEGTLIGENNATGQWMSDSIIYAWHETRGSALVRYGVGEPGEGDFVALRIPKGDQWLYAWIRIKRIEGYSDGNGPRVMQAAIETTLGLPIQTAKSLPNVHLSRTPLIANDKIRLSFATSNHFTYQIQTRPSVIAPWVNVGSPIVASGNSATADLPVSGDMGLFRVVEVE